MLSFRKYFRGFVCAAAGLIALLISMPTDAKAQTSSAPNSVTKSTPRSAKPLVMPDVATPPPAPPSEKDLSAIQEQLIKLLRLSPTLTTVVEHDPSLLANQEYVNRNNPQLGEFLLTHPEIARNPDFYLFTHLHEGQGGPDEALERAVWPQFTQPPRRALQDVTENLVPLLALACGLGTLIWLTRLFIENRRWSRIFKLQMDVHSRLIDKFSANEDLLVYMGTDAGKRFLEAAPIPVNFEPEQRVPNAVARVLTPLQIGIVLTLLGIGFLFLRHAQADMRTPMLVLGTIVLMPGLGFIISSGITWLLADRLGLMPDANTRSNAGPATSHDRLGDPEGPIATFSTRDRQ